MPIHLPPISRRRFLAGSIAALAAGRLPRGLFAADKGVNPNRIALFSDTHLAADAKAINREVCMFEHFQAAAADLLAQPTMPSAMLINGDLALGSGLPGDYITLTTCLKPIREAGIPAHLLLGNHDNRANFWKALPADDANKAVEAKHVGVIASKHADLILLDSLDVVNKTPGVLGAAQLAWLSATLNQQREKPCIVVMHHNPIAGPWAQKQTGVTDTAALMEVLLPRKQVKALVFGHTHTWMKSDIEGLPLVNLPPVAYVFGKTQPSGWVDCALAADSAKFTLRCIDQKHPAQGEVFEVKWRK